MASFGTPVDPLQEQTGFAQRQIAWRNLRNDEGDALVNETFVSLSNRFGITDGHREWWADPAVVNPGKYARGAIRNRAKQKQREEARHRCRTRPLHGLCESLPAAGCRPEASDEAVDQVRRTFAAVRRGLHGLEREVFDVFTAGKRLDEVLAKAKLSERHKRRVVNAAAMAVVEAIRRARKRLCGWMEEEEFFDAATQVIEVDVKSAEAMARRLRNVKRSRTD